MVVCSCNGIRERDLRTAARKGHKDCDAAYASLGCEFQCGGCMDHAEKILSDENTPAREIKSRHAPSPAASPARAPRPFGQPRAA